MKIRQIMGDAPQVKQPSRVQRVGGFMLYKSDWLVVWKHFCFSIYWEESSQLTNTVSTPTTFLAINLPQVRWTATRCFFFVAESTRCVVKTTHPPHCPFYMLDICLNPFNHHFFLLDVYLLSESSGNQTWQWKTTQRVR